MMNNGTTEISTTINFFRRYLLGESLKNILVRLTVILSAIIIVWCGIMFALIIHMKCQRAKQMQKTSNTHHHLYDSTTSLTRKRSNPSKRNRRFNSSSSSLSSTRCYSIRRALSQFKQHCFFWPSSSSSTTITTTTTVNENSLKKRRQRLETLPTTSSTVQLVVNTMTRQPLIPNDKIINIGKKISLYRETDSSSGDELKNLYPMETEQKSSIEIKQKTSNIIENKQLIEPKIFIHHPSISLPITEHKGNHQSTKRLQKLQQFNTKATLFFHPITRRLSNTNAPTCLPPTNTIENQQRRPLLMVASARDLASNNEWKWQHSLLDDPTTTTDGSIASSTRHIPLVMITDTSSSNTNILELETFEDEHRLVGDIERRLSRELRASYRPRHST